MIGGRTRSIVAAQRRSTSTVGHRPWPLPGARWVMGQTWEDLAFLHWPVSIDELRAVVPSQLPIDTFDGRPWLGITPFVVRGLRLRATPPLPVISSFPELNVRTYVSLEGKPGIYFLSLDAASRVAVAGARLLYRLPYYWARIDARRVGERLHYRSRRRVAQSAPLSRCRVRPYVPHRRGDPLAHFARRQDVVIWPLRPHRYDATASGRAPAWTSRSASDQRAGESI